MIKGPIRLLALLALALGALFAVPAIASAHTIKAVTPGAYCSHAGDVGQSEKGNWYICEEKGGHLRWEPTSGPQPTPTDETTGPTGGPTTEPPTTPPTTAPPTTTALPTTIGPTPSTSAASALPMTGTKEDVMAGVGAGAVALGGIGLWFGLRRRRTRVQFEA